MYLLKIYIPETIRENCMAMVNLPDETRDELRKYKAEYGDTYGEAVERLLQDSGWYDE
jgi:hypothetical protein